MVDNNEDEVFSDDPDEQLNIENEILKLKLQAELGGNYESEGILPPEMENVFLKNVIEFERNFANVTPKTLYDVLDRPNYPKAEILSDEAIENELILLENVMAAKGIVVDYADVYSPRLKYTFVTGELFQKESGFFYMPGMTMHYIYEEFHPNHRLDIENQTESFFGHWMKQNFNEFSTELSSQPQDSEGHPISREDLFTKFKNIFDSYTDFEEKSFSISNISFEITAAGIGSGTAEGEISYDAIMENGELQHFEGLYKLCLHYDGYWGINYFEWPGFVW